MSFRPGVMLCRGLVKRCPRCGSGHLFRRWFSMVERCPRCDYRFDREEGSWLGAYVVNFGVTEAGLAALFTAYIINQAGSSASGAIAPWIFMGLLVCVALPLVFYPFSKTIWTAIDLIMHKGRPGRDEV